MHDRSGFRAFEPPITQFAELVEERAGERVTL